MPDNMETWRDKITHRDQQEEKNNNNIIPLLTPYTRWAVSIFLIGNSFNLFIKFNYSGWSSVVIGMVSFIAQLVCMLYVQNCFGTIEQNEIIWLYSSAACNLVLLSKDHQRWVSHFWSLCSFWNRSRVIYLLAMFIYLFLESKKMLKQNYMHQKRSFDVLSSW